MFIGLDIDIRSYESSEMFKDFAVVYMFIHYMA